MPALQSSIANGWRDEGGGLEDRKNGKSISEKVALGGFENRMPPLLISRRESCLKLGCLAVLAANATRWLGDEI